MGFYRERKKCQYLHGTYAAHAHIVYTYAAQGMYVACHVHLSSLFLAQPNRSSNVDADGSDADGSDAAGLAGCRRPAWLPLIS